MIAATLVALFLDRKSPTEAGTLNACFPGSNSSG